jgi:hypothetical protein
MHGYVGLVGLRIGPAASPEGKRDIESTPDPEDPALSFQFLQELLCRIAFIVSEKLAGVVYAEKPLFADSRDERRLGLPERGSRYSLCVFSRLCSLPLSHNI